MVDVAKNMLGKSSGNGSPTMHYRYETKQKSPCCSKLTSEEVLKRTTQKDVPNPFGGSKMV